MPKADRCEQLKKEAQKTQKKLAAERQVAEKARQKEAELAAPAAVQAHNHNNHSAPATAEATSAKKSGKAAPVKSVAQASTTFAKAALIRAEEEENEHEVPEPAVEEAFESQAPAPKKKESNTSKKLQEKQKHKDEMQMLAEEQKAAMRTRIRLRFLRILIVGIFLEARESRAENNGKAGKEVKPKKKGKNGFEDSNWSVSKLREKADVFSGPFFLVAFVVAMFAARVFEEGYNPDSSRLDGENFYDVLGLPHNSEIMSVRKAYKNLALSWHPDKNPGCEACPARFAKISEAYDTLSNPEKKKAYDQHRAPQGSLEAVHSVELTNENFEARVARSNDVWIVEVYNPNDQLCKAFHPIWEDVSQSHDAVARFGRLDASSQKRALEFLPQRAVLLPVVWIFARGRTPEMFLYSGAEEPNSAQLARFIADEYPPIQRFKQAAELRAWWGRPGAKLLLSGPLSAGLRGSTLYDFMQVQRVAQTWGDFLGLAAADQRLAAEVLGSKSGDTKGNGWALIYRPADQAEPEQPVVVRELKEVVPAAKEIIARAIGGQAPSLTVRSHHQLCGAGGHGEASQRTFCLILVDASEATVEATLSQLKESRGAYAQEVLELKNSGEGGDSTEELFHIQPARIATSTSRLPWRPSGAGPSFRALWAEVDRAPAFVLELETRRVAAVKTPSMKDLFQQIAYEDLKFKELPQDLPLTRSLPDPETSLGRELRQVLDTPIGALLAFLLLAVAVAVVPELSLLTTVSSGASLLALLMLCWPGFCRRFLNYAF